MAEALYLWYSTVPLTYDHSTLVWKMWHKVVLWSIYLHNTPQMLLWPSLPFLIHPVKHLVWCYDPRISKWNWHVNHKRLAQNDYKIGLFCCSTSSFQVPFCFKTPISSTQAYTLFGTLWSFYCHSWTDFVTESSLFSVQYIPILVITVIILIER